MQDVQDELAMTHGKLAQFKMSLLMLSRCVDGLEDLKKQFKSLTMSYSGIADLAEERHPAYMLRFIKSEESLVVNEQPVQVTVDMNQATVVAQIKNQDGERIAYGPFLLRLRTIELRSIRECTECDGQGQRQGGRQ